MKHVLIILLMVSGAAFGDSIRPAYLEIVENNPGVVDVVWKVPKVRGLPADLWPALPDSYNVSSSRQELDRPDTRIFKWSAVGEPLAGQTIGITGLEGFTMDALLRIQLSDGTTLRTVLRPTSPTYTIPMVEPLKRRLPLRSWLYPVLFLAAFGLSLTPSAKKRGIVLCVLALLGGSVAGHALGTAAPKRERMTEEKAKRILQGLMLNTYRAFLMETDEFVYEVLSRGVEGDALNTIYLENRSQLSFDDPESAASLVDRLDVKSVESMERNRDGSISIRAAWDVYGTVFHWEHEHFRCNAFTAEITIAPANGYWKISALEILDQARVI